MRARNRFLRRGKSRYGERQAQVALTTLDMTLKLWSGCSA